MLEYLKSFQAEVHQRWPEIFQKDLSWPEQIIEEANYVLVGGKCVRPATALWLIENMQPEFNRDHLPWNSFASLEMIHSYSLVHDDLPAMDDDDIRRGKPSAHKKFGEASAILLGDSLLTGAFEATAKETQLSSAAVVLWQFELAQAAGAKGMIHGQKLDLVIEEQLKEAELAGKTAAESLDISQLENVHRLKTGALFGASGALAALTVDHRDQTLREQLRAWGIELGLLFQVVDDLLDRSLFFQKLGENALVKYCADLESQLIDELPEKINRDSAAKFLEFFLKRDH